MGANVKGTPVEGDSGLLEDLNCPISPTYSYLILLPKMLYAINYSGIKFYTCIGYKVTIITQRGFLPLVVVLILRGWAYYIIRTILHK